MGELLGSDKIYEHKSRGWVFWSDRMYEYRWVSCWGVTKYMSISHVGEFFAVTECMSIGG